MTRVLQATGWYPPGQMGGTEIYLACLVRGLREHGFVSRIIAPERPDVPAIYGFDGTLVRSFAVNPKPSREELRSELPDAYIDKFRAILDEERPEIYHQHSWSRGLGGWNLQTAHELGLTTVLTVHTPNVSCLRGTMMLFGERECDGRIDPYRCGACRANMSGLPRPLARVLAATPSVLGRLVDRWAVDTSLGTAFSLRNLVALREAEVGRMIANADRIVAVCQWLFECLVRNGVPRSKLILSRQGVDERLIASLRELPPAEHSDPLRLGFIGRWHPTKGIDILIEAVRSLPLAVAVTLDLYATGTGLEERAYEAKIRMLMGDDPRIAFKGPVAREDLARTLQSFDVLAVPSVSLETGPLVVLEALAAGLKIVGTNAGGISELVQSPEDGILVAPGDVHALMGAIASMAKDIRHVRAVRRLRDVRTMSNAVEDMAVLYQSLI